MLTPAFLLKALPIVAIMLAAFIYIVVRVLSRLRPRDENAFAAGRSSDSSENRQAGPPDMHPLRGVFRAVVAAGNGNFEAEAKDVSLAGASIVCAEPLAVGERLTLALELETPLHLHAAVTWNNRNVPASEVVSRGMRVRFLDVSAEARRALVAPRP